ncbi:L,D-transpeptidase [Streptomyces sp. IBSBF 2435]|uniref:L,D-transpeptidase n=1 Tax=Streptomyces sp. IBSBF 2435 TaxID=2903531 RepID=UPI003FA6C80E
MTEQTAADTATGVEGAAAGGRRTWGVRSARGRRGLMALALGAVLLGAAACGGDADAHSGADGKNGSANGSAPANGSQAALTVLPANGATGVDTSGALKVSAAKGKLTKVAVTSQDGTPVDGAISADGGSWTPKGTLRTNTHYSVSATATDTDGKAASQQSAFTTVKPTASATNYGIFNVDSGKTYGVGMEVSIRFNKPVTNQADVRHAVTVTAEPSVPVEGHWFSSQRIDFRPENYWAAGTKVTLHLKLDGVKTSKGVYGAQYKDVTFTIGRSQTSVADNKTKMLTIYRDGKLLKTYPTSLGDAGHTTYNGKMVIEEKDKVVDMDSQTVGLGNAYRIKDVPHGMRLSDSGTFAHGNYWRPASTFGHENTSHGCVGLRDVKGGGDPTTPAAWFYDHSLIGDVVQVVNSPDKVIPPSNGLNGWNMAWSSWVES